MARRQWGWTCPVDGTQLLEGPSWGGQLFCPNQRHDGRPKTHPLGEAPPTPALFNPADAQEGWTMAEGAGSGLTQAQVRAMKAAKVEQEDADRAPASAEGAAQPVKQRARSEPKECQCGCGEMTKGGRFKPGHDAKLHSRLRAEKEAKEAGATA